MSNENIEKNDNIDIVDDDIVYDETESVSDIIKKLKEKIKSTQKEKDEYLNNWQRERADFVNFKKDEDTRMNRLRNSVKENFTESLLPILDSFSIAFSNKESWEKVDENWRKGVEYIHQQFSQVLSDNGVSTISPKYLDDFNPALHQSIEDREVVSDDESGKIISVIQNGYTLGETVLRPARVITGKNKLIVS